jgi:wobble nucleotide-excising tRNase
MISRIQLLRNIGQFDSVSTGATISLARLTLIYSENGRGKTTLAAVLRSLATGDPLPITERRRLAAQHPPHVILECSGGPPPSATFANNAWNRTLSGLVVFDDVFIDQNVHSGLVVHAHHRQNLHELILGAQAVALSRSLQALVAQIEIHNSELRAKERAIPGEVRGPFSLADFCALPARGDIDKAIREGERALAAAREQDAVRTTPPFQSLSLPGFDLPAIERLLQQDLPALDSATVARVQAHLGNIGEGGEAWVADGIRRTTLGRGAVGPDTCPFCGQDIRGSLLIQHYRAYFSEAYASLKRDVSDMLAAVNQTHGREVPASFERALRVTVERRQFWSRFCEVAEVTLDTAAIFRDWQAAREAVVAQLSAKQAAPLEAMRISDEIRALVGCFEAHRSVVTAINRQLHEANRAIDVAKERVATANPAVLENDLARLKAIKARHEPAILTLCNEYLQARAAKDTTEEQRDRTRAALEQHRTTAFPGYQTAINLYLPRFNAGFRLDSVAYANTRGGPTCTYNVLINNTPVPVGGADPAPGEPSFRNTLSAGDRNTLALAFFFASLDEDAGLADKVVVIDDPISSMDEHRALTTVQEIRRLAERAGQVIVLSHNKAFLCRLWEGGDPTARAAVEVVRDGTGSNLRAWDVAQDSITEHDRRYTRLHEFLSIGTGDMREVARSIRPHLEAFLRVACPERFTPGTLLGPFQNLCRQRQGTPREILDQAAIQELDAIVEYANRFHHDTNPAWETEAINDSELRGFVERALKFCRK